MAEFRRLLRLPLYWLLVFAPMTAADGESNWLEGAELLALYLILALAFFLLH